MIWLLLACASDKGGEDTAGFPEEFYGQHHQVTTYQVEDTCFDGAMTLLFMPDGDEVPQEFSFPIYIPRLDELPMSYEISLREPFIGMEVTATDNGNGEIAIGDALMEEVALGLTFGECKATMDVAAQIVPSDDHFDVSATVTMSDLRGDEQGCPVPLSDVCQVTLSMEAVPWTE